MFAKDDELVTWLGSYFENLRGIPECLGSPERSNSQKTLKHLHGYKLHFFETNKPILPDKEKKNKSWRQTFQKERKTNHQKRVEY